MAALCFFRALRWQRSLSLAVQRRNSNAKCLRSCPTLLGHWISLQQIEEFLLGQDEAARPTFAQVITRLRKLLHGETERLRRSKSKGAGLSTPVRDIQERPGDLADTVGQVRMWQPLACNAGSKQCRRVSTVFEGGGGGDPIPQTHASRRRRRKCICPARGANRMIKHVVLMESHLSLQGSSRGEQSPLSDTYPSPQRFPDAASTPGSEKEVPSCISPLRSSSSLRESASKPGKDRFEPGSQYCDTSCSSAGSPEVPCSIQQREGRPLPEIGCSMDERPAEGHASHSQPATPHRLGSFGFGQKALRRQGSSSVGTPSRFKSKELSRSLEITECDLTT